MRRKRTDPLEQAMRSALNRKEDDDVVRQVIIVNGEEFVYAEKTREIVWRTDPQTGELVPYSMSVSSYSLGDDGRAFGKFNVAVGKCGCMVRADSVLTCRHCKSLICQKHAIFVGRRTYCQEGWCAVIGRISQVLWALYRIGRFCIRSVLGLHPEDRCSSSSVEAPPALSKEGKSGSVERE